MTSVAFTSLISPHSQAKSPAGEAQLMTGFGMLLGTGAAPKAMDFEVVFASPGPPAPKMPLLSNIEDALDTTQLGAADAAFQAMFGDATATATTLQLAQTVGADASLLVVEGGGTFGQTTVTIPVVDQADLDSEGSLGIEAGAVPMASRPGLESPIASPVTQAPSLSGDNAPEPLVTVLGKLKAAARAPSVPTINGALSIADVPNATNAQYSNLMLESVEATTGASGLVNPNVLSVAPKPPSPPLPPSGARTTLLTGARTTALFSDKTLELTPSASVLMKPAIAPAEITQVGAARNEVLVTVLPNQVAAPSKGAGEDLATAIEQKSSGVTTLVEATVTKPQASLEWYNKVANTDTFRATNISPNLPAQQVGPPPLSSREAHAPEVATNGKYRFAEAITAQIKSVDVTQERTHIALNPRGLGSIDIEISQGADNNLKITIRAENPVVLQTLREERNLLAQAIGFESGATLAFQQQTRDDQAGSANSDEQNNHEPQAGETKGESNVKEKVEVIARNRLDITT